jgi:hypothetical protein
MKQKDDDSYVAECASEADSVHRKIADAASVMTEHPEQSYSMVVTAV